MLAAIVVHDSIEACFVHRKTVMNPLAWANLAVLWLLKNQIAVNGERCDPKPNSIASSASAVREASVFALHT
jgi:hypothetical protein